LPAPGKKYAPPAGSPGSLIKVVRREGIKPSVALALGLRDENFHVLPLLISEPSPDLRSRATPATRLVIATFRFISTSILMETPMLTPNEATAWSMFSTLAPKLCAAE
jgi:hypothetical protein